MEYADTFKAETINAVNGLADKIKQDYDRTLIYTGDKREGKSTLAQEIADLLSCNLSSNVWISYFFRSYPDEQERIPELRRELDLEDTNIYPGSLQYAQEQGGIGDQIIADESITFLQRGKWNSPDAVSFTINHDIYGSQNYVYHLLMPTFDFTKGFREARVHIWFYVPKRGALWIYKPRRTPKKIYWPDNPIWRDKFPPLSPDDERRYRKIKSTMLNLRKELSQEIDPKAKLQQQVTRLYERFPDARQVDAGYVFGVSHQTIGRILKRPLSIA